MACANTGPTSRYGPGGSGGAYPNSSSASSGRASRRQPPEHRLAAGGAPVLGRLPGGVAAGASQLGERRGGQRVDPERGTGGRHGPSLARRGTRRWR
ncbi:hypothetical protein [Micromonospora sp. WMMD1219]|uniref:hypothetical protein n=1 Tax=Micromonospora sp. WMMD1219 TaxID=3404115 RepID=UPI003BF58723